MTDTPTRADDPLPIRDDAAGRLSGHLPPPSPSPRWRLFDRLVVIVFCIGLVVPGILLGAGVRPATIENRPLLTPAPISVDGLIDGSWFASIDRALADNIAFRPLAVRLRGLAFVGLGGTGNPNVVRGVDPWLFTLEEIQPRCDVGAADIAADLDRTAAAFTAAGQDFRFVLAPDKHPIYPEKLDPQMPYGPACTDDRRPAMEAALDARPFAIDGWAAIRAEKAANPGGPLLYYTADSHWTRFGARPAIRGLIQSLGPDLWNDADVVPGPNQKVNQELARQLGLPRTETVPGLLFRPGVKITRKPLELPFKTTAAAAVYRITATGDRPLVPGLTVVVYDSFFGLNMTSISPYFAESIWIHMNDLKNHPEIATLIGRADRVVMERVERGLYFTKFADLLEPLVRAAG